MKKLVEIEKIVTSKEVARIMKVTQRTLSNWVKTKNLIPIVVLENGSFLFDSDDLKNVKIYNKKD